MATHCVFHLAGGCWALDVALVAEVVPPQEPRRLPLLPPAVLGLVLLRGQALAAIDLATLLGLAAPAKPPRHLLILGQRSRLAAAPIAGLVGVLRAEPGGFTPAERHAEPAPVAGFQTYPGHPGISAALIDSGELLARIDALKPHATAIRPS